MTRRPLLTGRLMLNLALTLIRLAGRRFLKTDRFWRVPTAALALILTL
jgi:hypothetical protein